MSLYEHYHDTVHWHMSDITSRIIAESRIPSDRFHLGKVILQSLKDSPDLLAQSKETIAKVYHRMKYEAENGVENETDARWRTAQAVGERTISNILKKEKQQIEGTSGELETNSYVLQRTVKCAIAMKKLGLQTGEVMILMAPNHLDLVVPFYAALYLGVIVAPIDRHLGIYELQGAFNISKAKLVFCQSEKVEDIRKALLELEVKPKVITFDKGNGDMNFLELLGQTCDLEEVSHFRCADFDPAETIAMLISTSGSTGFPKQAAATHKNFSIMSPYLWIKTVQIPTFERSLVVAPLQWLSAILLYICAPYMKYTRVQSRQDSTQEHVYQLINKYRPSFLFISPTMLTTLIRPGDRDKCDFSCFERIIVGGSSMCSNLLEELEKLMPKTDILNVYGMSELTNISFTHGFSTPPLSCGKPMGCLQYRLVDVETGNDINEPYVKGELWLKGPVFFKGYYKNPDITQAAFEGDWFKSGDLLYRDEQWNFYHVERIKFLLKYKNHQISPAELEAVLREHPGVLDAAVAGIPDPECGDLPVAFVVRAPGQEPTEQDIKDYVKESLTDTKQLRGGVIFLEQLPLTASTKLHRRKIKEMALALKKE